jgi:hypothetical protein
MLLLVSLLPLWGCLSLPPDAIRVDNPYADASWHTDHHRKTSLHVHTKVSDGRLYPHEAIDAYKALSYDILAITDHNKVTHPWTTLHETYGEGYENRDPVVVGMKDIRGNELSSHHHMGSYWADHNGTETEDESLQATAAKGGQTLLCHPGRYKKPDDWYVDLFTRYPHLKGMEVYNQGDRYPGDREKWDNILTLMMPDRPVWAFSNDDMHRREHLGRNWNVLLIRKPTDTVIRRALDQGQFYFVYCPKGHDGAAPPEINSITVNERKGTIAIEAENFASIQWISEGKVVDEGTVLNLRETEGLGSYVRAVLHGPADDTIAGTQPFGLRRPQ